MAWLSVHEGLRDHPKTRHLSKLLGCSRHEAIGLLVSLWLWGLNNADRDGRLPYADEEDIADGVMLRGSTYEGTPAEFVSCLVTAGWLDIGAPSDAGSYALHDWDQWQEFWYKAIDRREKDNERKRVERRGGQSAAASAGQSDGQSDGQSAGRSQGQSRHKRNHNGNGNGNNNEIGNEAERGDDTALAPASPPVPFEKVRALFNTTCRSYPEIRELSENRKRVIAGHWKKGRNLDALEEIFKRAEASPFLKGENDRQWRATFDWIIKPANWLKIAEGNYDEDHGEHGRNGGHYEPDRDHERDWAAGFVPADAE